MAWVYSPDGRPGQVPDENLEKALALGYTRREPAPDEVARATTTEQPLRAGIEGAVRGASLGFAEPLIVGYAKGEGGLTDAEARQQVKLRKEENPIAETVGQVGGGLALSLATGGGASALVGGGIKGAALEGGLYGLGSMAGEATLDDTELTAQKAAAGMLGGALAGGGTAGAFKVLGKGVSAGVKKLGGMTSAKTLEEMGREVKWDALAQGNKRWAKANADYKESIINLSDKLGISALDDASVEKASAYAKQVGEEIGSAIDHLDALSPLKKDDRLRSSFVKALKGSLSQYRNNPSYKDALARADSMLAQVAEGKMSWGDVWRWQDSIYESLPQGEATGTKRLFETLRSKIRNHVMEDVAPNIWEQPEVFKQAARAVPEVTVVDRPSPVAQVEAALPGDLTVPGTPSALQGATEIIPQGELGRDFQKTLVNIGRRSKTQVIQPDEVTSRLFEGTRVDRAPQTFIMAGESTLPEATVASPFRAPREIDRALGERLRAAGREYATAKALEEALANRVQSIESSAGPLGIGSLRTLGGMAVGGAVGGIPGALAAGVLERQAMKRGGFILGNVLQTLGKSPTLNNLGNALYKRVGQMLSVDPMLLGAFRIPIEEAFAQGADVLLATHLALGKDPNYLATMGMTPETPGEVEAAGQRMAHTDALVNAAAAYDESVEGAVDGLLGAKPGRRAAIKMPKTGDFKERLALIQDIARNPDKAFEGVPGEFFNSAPNLSGGVAGSVVAAAQFLADKAPKSPYEGMPEALKQPWQPSQADLEKWYRYVDALEGGPSRLLQLASQGALTREHIEATQAIYPRLYDDLRNRLMERLSSWEKPLPYSTKVSLSQFFGPQVLGMSPGAMQVIQQSFSAGAGEPSGGMGRPDGRQQVSQEKNLATQAQRIEGR